MERLYEDKYILALDKPAGLQTEPDAHGYPSLLDEARKYLEFTQKKRPIFIQPVHRLDRPVSGVVLFALKPSALKILNMQFAKRMVSKTYLAITDKRLHSDSGSLSHYLKKDALQKRAIVRDTPFAEAAEVRLDYELLACHDAYYYWKIRLHTGKYHQIRAQMGFAGCPILGDERYGSTIAYRPGAIGLHAVQLDFNHPVSGERLHLEAPLPEDAWWNKLKTDHPGSKHA